MPLGDWDIKLSFDAILGGIGFGAEVNSKELSFGATIAPAGFGFSIGLDFDLRR